MDSTTQLDTQTPLDVNAVMQAKHRISPYIIETPLRPAMFPLRDEVAVFYKCEHVQVSGAFKVRGALNKLLKNLDDQRPVVAASTGNHGTAVAYAARCLGRKAKIFMPTNTPPKKRQRIESLGAEVLLVGTDCIESEAFARKQMESGHALYVSPYNDPDVIEGQATLGLELYEQNPRLSHVIVSVGGGGLISGVAQFLKAKLPHLTIIGASPLNSNVMARSAKSGKVESWSGTPTVSSSTAGGLESPCITLPLCQTFVDQWIDVDESSIINAMQELERDELIYVEGAAALADAAKSILVPNLPRGSSVAVVLCGANR